MTDFRTMLANCLAFALLCILAAPVAGQQIQMRRQRGPYYVGEPVAILIDASGFEGGQEPTCQLKNKAPQGLRIVGPEVGRQSSSFTQIINGRVTKRESSSYRFTFEVTADREGEFTVGPFAVLVDGRESIVEGATFQFGTIENDEDMEIELTLPQSSIYVGQQVPISIRWLFAGEFDAVQYAFQQLQIRSPLFDQCSFKDEPVRRGSPALTIITAKGTVNIPADQTTERLNGRDYFVLTAKRILIADKPGDFDQIPITCRTKKVVSWGRDLFGDPVARSDTPALAAGAPFSFSVKPLPLSGRPDSFAGAVGNGFSIDVAANRSVVRVGDPIALTITVRGDGNVEKISLPQLSADDGLSDTQFQIPAEHPAGNYDGTAKQFKVNIRVKDQSIHQIPGIAFSWFDPINERYDTCRSKPIALQVMETQVVSAADVVASPSIAAPQEKAGGNRSDSSQPSNLSLVGANLAIERDAAKLAMNAASASSRVMVAFALYLLSAAIVAGSIVWRFRSQMDKSAVERKNQLKSFRKRIEASNHLPPRDAAAQIAQVLRELIVCFKPTDRVALDATIAQCENAIYATDLEDPSGIKDITRRALQIVETTAEP